MIYHPSRSAERNLFDPFYDLPGLNTWSTSIFLIYLFQWTEMPIDDDWDRVMYREHWSSFTFTFPRCGALLQRLSRLFWLAVWHHIALPCLYLPGFRSCSSSLSTLVYLPLLHSYFLVLSLVTCSLPFLPLTSCFTWPQPKGLHHHLHFWLHILCVWLCFHSSLRLDVGQLLTKFTWSWWLVQKWGLCTGPCIIEAQMSVLTSLSRVFTLLSLQLGFWEAPGIWGGALVYRGFTLVYQLPILPSLPSSLWFNSATWSCTFSRHLSCIVYSSNSLASPPLLFRSQRCDIVAPWLKKKKVDLLESRLAVCRIASYLAAFSTIGAKTITLHNVIVLN